MMLRFDIHMIYQIITQCAGNFNRTVPKTLVLSVFCAFLDGKLERAIIAGIRTCEGLL